MDQPTSPASDPEESDRHEGHPEKSRARRGSRRADHGRACRTVPSHSARPPRRKPAPASRAAGTSKAPRRTQRRRVVAAPPPARGPGPPPPARPAIGVGLRSTAAQRRPRPFGDARARARSSAPGTRRCDRGREAARSRSERTSRFARSTPSRSEPAPALTLLSTRQGGRAGAGARGAARTSRPCRSPRRSAACSAEDADERRRRAAASTTPRWTASRCGRRTPAARRPSARCELTLAGESRAGAPGGARRSNAGEAVRISTGAMVPPGADAVRAGRGHGASAERVVEIRVEVPPGKDIRRAGEDIARGRAGARGRPAPRRRPSSAWRPRGRGRAALRGAGPACRSWSTGDELIPPGRPLAPGQIRNTNGYRARRRRRADAGAVVAERTTVGDDYDATVEALRAGAARRTSRSSTGGVSVGPHDHVKPALAELGVEEVFWGVALRPGQADLVRHATTAAARLRPARQPGVGDGHLPSVRAAGALARMLGATRATGARRR